jgi:hypothetical protein
MCNLFILNPTTWGKPAFIVENRGGVLNIVSTSYSYDNETIEDIDFDRYEVESYPLGTRFIESSFDAYPEDDPGHCFVEYFEVQAS